MLNSWPLYSQSCPGPARMLTTASASSCLWSGPHQFTASGGQDDVCNKVHAWHHTPEPSPPYPPGLLLRVLCPSVPQMYTLRSLAYRGNSRCYQAPNLSRPIQLPFREAFLDFSTAEGPFLVLGLPPLCIPSSIMAHVLGVTAGALPTRGGVLPGG